MGISRGKLSIIQVKSWLWVIRMGKRVLVETEETRIQLTCNADHLKDGTISVISYMIREFLYLLFIIIVLMYIISVYINL